MGEEWPHPLMALLLGVPCVEPELALGRSQHHVQRHTPKLCCGTKEKEMKEKSKEGRRLHKEGAMCNKYRLTPQPQCGSHYRGLE